MKLNLKLHVVIIIHRVRTKSSAAEITAATAAAAAVAACNKATNKDCSLCKHTTWHISKIARSTSEIYIIQFLNFSNKLVPYMLNLIPKTSPVLLIHLTTNQIHDSNTAHSN